MQQNGSFGLVQSVVSSAGQQHVLASNRSADLAPFLWGVVDGCEYLRRVSMAVDSSGALSMDVGSVGPSSRRLAR
jgi:hypothetical protein